MQWCEVRWALILLLGIVLYLAGLNGPKGICVSTPVSLFWRECFAAVGLISCGTRHLCEETLLLHMMGHINIRT